LDFSRITIGRDFADEKAGCMSVNAGRTAGVPAFPMATLILKVVPRSAALKRARLNQGAIIS